MEKKGKEGLVGEGVLLAFGRRSNPCLQVRRRRMEEWVLVPTESETGQLVVVVQVAEQWLAAVVAAYFSDHLSFLVVPFCFLYPSPIHCAAAAGIGIEGVGFLQV